jgi:sterol desaturase/sphingolipid hydroxylase (fatty acid hydroxylase superfamily)
MRDRLRPNLVLSGLTLALGAALNVALVGALTWRRVHPPTLVVVVVLDFAAWLAHWAMHKSALLWRVHRVHHCDPAVDVTTALRQHPGEGVVRFVFLTAFALALGASPASVAVYRGWSVASALLEHADLRLPLDRVLSLFVVTPGAHRAHHARARCDVNYGNIFTVWDRLLGTFTRAVGPVGLDGYDGPQTTLGLLKMPFHP